jgi:hypothetical protein
VAGVIRVVVVALALTFAGVALAANGQPKRVLVPAVQAKAKAINVQRSDLPDQGWKAKKSSSNSSTPRCSYYNPDQSDLTENGHVDSPQFTLPSGSFVSSTTGIFKSAAQGKTAYGRVVQPALPKCLADIFRKGTGHPSQVTIVSAGPVSFPNSAERTNAYRVVASFKVSKTQTVPVYIDLVAMNRGKVDTALFFAGIGGAFNSSFEHDVAAKIAGRMASA